LTYLSTVLADAPVHYWRFADPGGFLAHDIGSAPVHLTGGFNSPMGWSGIAADGGSGFCAGSSGFETLDVVTQARPFTVEGWFWWPYKNPALESLWYWDGVAANQMFLYRDANHLLNMGGTGVTAIGPVGDPASQSWHHIVGVFAAAATNLWLDGVNIAGNATAVASPVARKLGLGMQPGDGQVTVAFITEAAVYGVALSNARIAAHFAAQEVTQAPVFFPGGNPSNLGYGSAPPVPVGGWQDILSSVRKTY
jgi:hypothetical protein